MSESGFARFTVLQGAGGRRSEGSKSKQSDDPEERAEPIDPEEKEGKGDPEEEEAEPEAATEEEEDPPLPPLFESWNSASRASS